MNEYNLSEEAIAVMFMDVYVDITVMGEQARRRAEGRGNLALAREVQQLEHTLPGFFYEGEKLGGAAVIICFPRRNDYEEDRLSFVHGNQSVKEMVREIEEQEAQGACQLASSWWLQSPLASPASFMPLHAP